MGTSVRLTRSGGIAGLSMVASVDLDDLPTATARKIRAALARVSFDLPTGDIAGPPGAADAYQYDLVVTDGRGGRRTLTVHEPVPGSELQALFDLLLPLARPE